eukprot:1186461-Prorocentrum_minimum.AAC.2
MAESFSPGGHRSNTKGPSFHWRFRSLSRVVLNSIIDATEAGGHEGEALASGESLPLLGLEGMSMRCSPGLLMCGDALGLNSSRCRKDRC